MSLVSLDLVATGLVFLGSQKGDYKNQRQFLAGYYPQGTAQTAE